MLQGIGAEWLHNRLELVCSMPAWNNPMREFQLWSRERIWITLNELFRHKALTSAGVVDPIVPLADAPRTFMDIYRQTVNSMKMGIRFDHTGAM